MTEEQQMPYVTHQGHRLFYREQGRGPLLVNASEHPLMWSRPADFRAAADAFLGMLQV